ncbi:SDR family NAD(P)-dependent oxidoreductase [Enemella sp. A6]|uniref:SDR family NAD(P)-dependent oxidoreductase n=1 Tax=Enemella sp. A6 TaxID=3440152 RepID=UPI003EC0C707
MTQPRFAGKHVLITGASSGIGQATSARFVAEGAKVFGLARSTEGLEETKSMCDNPDMFNYASCDVGDEASITAAVKAGAEFLDGKINVVANVAGLTVKTPIAGYDSEVARTLMDVNFHGPMRVIAEALPHMVEGVGSSIINISSTSATQAMPELTAYGASKAALVTATMGLAVELAPKRIRAVSLSPSGVKTKMMWDIWEQVKDYDGDWYGRLLHLWGQEESGEAAELAAFICFAASDDAVYWNAADLRIDGGARASL